MVTIVVSTGAEAVRVPEVRGMGLEAAKEMLVAEGLNYTVVDQDTTDPAKVGMILDQIPLPGVEVERGYNVRIFVGRAP